MAEIKSITLSELMGIIKGVINKHTAEYWLRAEIVSLRDDKGYCLMTLAEKSDKATIAQIQATICKSAWSFDPLFGKIGIEF